VHKTQLLTRILCSYNIVCRCIYCVMWVCRCSVCVPVMCVWVYVGYTQALYMSTGTATTQYSYAHTHTHAHSHTHTHTHIHYAHMYSCTHMCDFTITTAIDYEYFSFKAIEVYIPSCYCVVNMFITLNGYFFI